MCALWVSSPKPDGSPGEGWLCKKEGTDRPWVVQPGDDWTGYRPYLFESPEDADAWKVLRVLEAEWWFPGFQTTTVIEWVPPKEYRLD